MGDGEEVVDSGVLGVCVWHARDALLLKTDAPHIHTSMRDFDRTPTSAGFWGILGPRRAERSGSSISRRRHNVICFTHCPYLRYCSAPRGLGGYLASPSSVAFPIVWMWMLILSPHVGLREVRGSVSCVVAEQSSSAALLLWPTRLDLS